MGIGPADVHSREPRKIPLISAGAKIIGDGVLAKAENLNIVFCQLVPWQFDRKLQNVKRTFRRTSYLVNHLLVNMGANSSTPVLENFHNPVNTSKTNEKRWLNSFYMDIPEEWDDPYRFFRW